MILFQTNLRAVWEEKRLAVLNKITALSEAPKCFEPLLVTTIPIQDLRAEGCGIKVAAHVNRDFSGERGKISETGQ